MNNSRIFLLNEDCLVLILKYLRLPDLISLDVAACGDKKVQSSGGSSYLCSLQHLTPGNLMDTNKGHKLDDPSAWSPQSVVWAGRKNLSCLISSSRIVLGIKLGHRAEGNKLDSLRACMDMALGVIGAKCTMLSEVVLQGQAITDRGVAELLAAHGAPIRLLGLEYCGSGVTDAAFATISEHLRDSLEDLSITCAVSDAGLIQVITGCPKISSLTLRYSTTNHLYREIKECPIITPATFFAIAQNLPNLRCLNCDCWGFNRYNREEFPSDAFVAIAEACDLHSLSVGYVRVDDTLLVALGASCPKLAVFENLLGDGEVVVSDVGITALALGCPELHYIGMTHVSGATDVGMTALGKHCKKLEGFTLPRDITDSGLEIVMKACKALDRLYVEDCDALTVASASTLAKNGGDLTMLQFHDISWVDDAALLIIAEGCQSLSVLELVSYGDDDDDLLLITNEGLLAAVRLCPKMEKVTLRGTLVTPEGCKDLMRALPGVEVCDA